MKDKIKNILKKSKIINNINATLKCKQLKRQYSEWVSYYQNKQQQYMLEELMEQKGFTKEWKESLKGKRLNVYFFGKDEFQDKSGFIQDLSKLCNLTYFVKEDGSYGRYDEEKIYDDKLGKELNTDALISSIKNLCLNDKKPDFVFFQAYGKTFNIDKLMNFKIENDLKFINICLDDRLIYKIKNSKNKKYDDGAIGLKSVIDLALISNPEVVDWYLKENVPAIYFPMASSVEFYYPMDVEKKYDVGFIGNKYGYREELVTALQNAGMHVEARGTGWSAGRIKLEENNRFFNECKIILGIGTVGHCKDFYTQKLRDFDAPLSGGVYVTHNNKDLHNLYEVDKEIILCNSIEEYINKIKYLLRNPERMELIAKNAYKKASKEHTYEKRFIKLFKLLGLNK